MMKRKLFEQFKKYHFEWKHLAVLFLVLIFFQLLVSYINKVSLHHLIDQTENWYKLDSAEKIANLTSTSIELLMETNPTKKTYSAEERRELIQAFNIIFSQQILQRNILEVCLLGEIEGQYYAIDNGQSLFDFFYLDNPRLLQTEHVHDEAVGLYKELEEKIRRKEQILSLEEGQVYKVFVPLVPRGEYFGALFMRIKPDFGFITTQITSNYDETALIFSALILFGLLAMFYISAYTVRERDEAQQLLFKERERYIKEHIAHQKEALFTKRIYHTHHKAEKIMGFIKEDLRNLNPNNFEDIRHRISQYANFISRVIYDMKWYDPPLQTIRSPIFKTDLNGVIRFIVDAIFQRTSSQSEAVQFTLKLDDRLPLVNINEFVVWEIIEPLIQNAIDHSKVETIHVEIQSHYDAQNQLGTIRISDNGKGIREDLLGKEADGIQRLFLENISTKEEGRRTGYGCYLSYQIALRCGWKISAENRSAGGASFIIFIPFGKISRKAPGTHEKNEGTQHAI
ncbi:ATP-binding protein [Calditrichota bacterium GD2]